jgi:hypothetical protein
MPLGQPEHQKEQEPDHNGYAVGINDEVADSPLLSRRIR